MSFNAEGLLCRQLEDHGSSKRMQVVIPLSLVETVLEVLHDSITAGHMGPRRTLACAKMGFTGISREIQ